MPSDPNALIEMLAIRSESYRAGNNGLRNEIVDLVDELLRQGVIDQKAYEN